MARSLGPTDRGMLAALVLWGAIAADLASVGASSGVSYWAASGSPRTGLVYLRSALPLMALVSLGIYAAIVLSSGRLESLPVVGIGVMAVWAVGRLFHDPVLRFQQGFGEMTKFNALRAVGEIGPTIGYAGLALFGALTVATGAVSITAFMLVAGGIGAMFIRRVGPPDSPETPAATDRKDFWSYSFRSWLSILATRGNRSIDLFVLTLIAVSAADVGLYTVAATSALILGVLGGSLGLDLFPKVAAIREDGDARPILRRFIGVSAAFSLVAAVGFFIFADWLVPLIYGQEFTGSIGPARVLVFGAVAVSVSRVAGQGLSGLGYPGRVALAEVAGTGITLVGVLVAANRSLNMVAGAAVAGYVVTMILILTFTWSSTRRSHT